MWPPRRRVLVGGALLSAAVALDGCVGRRVEGTSEDDGTSADVLPVEDLMREHGVLRRILLVYDEALRRLGSGDAIPVDALSSAADVVRRFVEDYHERQEEEGVFPRFRSAGTRIDLVDVLQAQHAAGRRLTDVVRTQARAVRDPSSAGARKVRKALGAFNRMYRPHAAWEDTVLFPAFRSIVSAHDYVELGETFERREEGMFGEQGFERIVHEVEEIQRAFGIADLDAFTPK